MLPTSKVPWPPSLGGVPHNIAAGSEYKKRSWARSPAKPTSAPTALVRALALLAVLLIGWNTTGPVIKHNRLNQFSRSRLAARDGDREAWIVQEKWQHPHGVLRRDSWLPCRRFMTLKLEYAGSLSDAMWSVLRAQVVADALGYTLLIDDTHWNLGIWRDYFNPVELQCEPPMDWAWPEAAAQLGQFGWEAHNRVFLSALDTPQLDSALRKHKVRTAVSVGMHHRLAKLELDAVLGPEETVPRELQAVFSAFTKALENVCRLNDAVQMMVINEHRTLRLGKRTENGRESGRPSIVAMQVNQAWADETDDGQAVGGGAESSLKDMLQAANYALDQLSTSTWRDSPSDETPVLLVSTTNPGLLRTISGEPLATSFVLETSTQPGPQSLLEWSAQLGAFGLSVKQLKQAGKQPVTAQPGDDQFDALPGKLKVHLAMLQLRDWVIAARHADAFVVSAATSEGRLACLFGAGETGERSAGPRVRSADTLWYPTSTFGALFDD